MPSSCTECWPGTAKASMRSRVSLTWLHISATRTSTRLWYISLLPRNCFSKRVIDFACVERRSCELRRKEEMHERNSVSSVVARFLPRLVGATTQRLASHCAVLPRHMAAVSAVRSCAEECTRSQARSERSHRNRGSRIPAVHRRGTKVLDWNPELPLSRAAQLLRLRCRARAFGGCTVRRSRAYSQQTSTSP